VIGLAEDIGHRCCEIYQHVLDYEQTTEMAELVMNNELLR
jgi:hypothetical protein